MTSLKRGCFRLCCSILLFSLLTEVGTRLAGLTTWKYRDRPQGIPTFHAPDEQLGWVPLPGSYAIPPFSSQGQATEVTILPDRSRSNGAALDHTKTEIWVFGGSFTFGTAVSDGETYVSHLARTHPDLTVKNFGVAAYGTYQSLLGFEQRAARKGVRLPAMVLYGFILQHEVRNIGAPWWLRELARNRHRIMPTLPYVTLGPEGRLSRHVARRYTPWTLSLYSSGANLFQQGLHELARIGTRGVAYRRQVTEELIKSFQTRAAEMNIRFCVVLLNLDSRSRKHYNEFGRKSGVPVWDCATPITPDHQVPGDGHPGPEIHRRFGACISARITEAWRDLGE